MCMVCVWYVYGFPLPLPQHPLSFCDQTTSVDMLQYLDLFYGDISLSVDGNSYRKCEECGASYKMFTFLDQVRDVEF